MAAFYDFQSDGSIMRTKTVLVYHPNKYTAHVNKSCMDKLCGNIIMALKYIHY